VPIYVSRAMIRGVLAVAMLASVALAGNADSSRLKSLSRKMMCDCGCREVLDECSHKQCTRKPALQQEIAASLAGGKSDDDILKLVAAAHGSDILLTPTFNGFNTLLWIVPVMIGVIAVGAMLMVQRRRAGAK